MSYNGSGTFVINSAGQPVVTGTVISSTAFNALTADLATGLSTAVTKDGQTTTTARVPFAQGISSTLVTDATSATTGSIITAGGISTQKALWVGTTTTLAGTLTGATGTFSGVLSSTNSVKSNPAAGNAYVYATRGSQAQGQVGYYLNGGTSSTDWIMYMDTSSDTFNIFGNSSTRLSITTAGLVGIGMTPSNILDITQTQNGGSIINILNSSAGAAAQAVVRATNNSAQLVELLMLGSAYTPAGALLAGAGSIYCNGTALSLVSQNGPILFATNSTTEKMRLDNSGNLLVGLTSSVVGGVLEAYSAAGNCAAFRTGGSSTAALQTYVSNTGAYLAYFLYSGGNVGSITTNGTITAYNVTSDARLKTLIGPHDNGGLFDHIEWNDFTWNSAPELGTSVGPFAQDIQKHLPNIVREGRGEPGDKDFQPYQVDMTGLVPYLGAEIKALRARVATLEARLTALETK